MPLLKKLAKVFICDIKDFFEEDKEPSPQRKKLIEFVKHKLPEEDVSGVLDREINGYYYQKYGRLPDFGDSNMNTAAKKIAGDDQPYKRIRKKK